MSREGASLPQVIGIAQTTAIQEALKRRLRAVGVHRVERRIGKPERFFANSRQRGKLKVQDFLATCSALELDPVEFIGEALGDQISPEIRPPRIVETAWSRIRNDGPGLGEERLAEIESMLQSNPRKTRGALSRAVSRANNEELPRILGLYGSCLRLETNLDRAKVVLVHARDIAVELEVPAAEADILIRLAYVALEKNQFSHGMRRAADAIVISARIHDREGQGIGFLTMGTFEYYRDEFVEALKDFGATLQYAVGSRQLIAAHQFTALCFIELNQEDEARAAIGRAKKISPQFDWMEGNLAWTEARLTYGIGRLDLLMKARDSFSKRPADRALVTVELIEEALKMGHDRIANREAFKLCELLEKTGNPRIEHAIGYLSCNSTMLDSQIVTKIRQALDAAQDRRISRLIHDDR